MSKKKADRADRVPFGKLLAYKTDFVGGGYDYYRISVNVLYGYPGDACSAGWNHTAGQ